MTALSLIPKLQVPADFIRYENITENIIITHLDAWKDNAHNILAELRALLNQKVSDLSLHDQATITSAVAAFDGYGPWITSMSRDVSQGILTDFVDPTNQLLVQVLSHNVKPLFRSNPHPSLNPSTGRKLARPAGGPMASQDYYEQQIWKKHPGAPNVVLWCVRHIKREAYEDLWHLIIPPIMTLLDDYEAQFKLRGVEIVSIMLEHIPKEVLKRTGVDGLIRSSLNICLTHLESPETPRLIQAAVATSVSLTTLTTVIGSSERFDQLCAILGEGIINGIWLYAAEQADVILASVEALPKLILALGIGTSRYLNGLIPQLIHPLLPNELKAPGKEMQLSSLRALGVIMRTCGPCIARWKGTILDGVGRCWVTLSESGNDSFLLEELRETWELLALTCPSVTEDEYEKLGRADGRVFGNLVNRKMDVGKNR